MNRRGTSMFFYLMLGTIIIVLGLALASPVKTIIDDQKTNLSCDNPTNMYDEAGCYGLDFLKILGISGIILTGFALIGARIAGWI